MMQYVRALRHLTTIVYNSSVKAVSVFNNVYVLLMVAAYDYYYAVFDYGFCPPKYLDAHTVVY